jgi:cell division protein ZapA
LSQGNGSGNVRVEIYDQTYHLRGSDPEYITDLAEYVDTKMRLIAQQAATVDSLRVAVLAALNIADEFHVLKRKYDSIATDYNERAGHLEGALDEVLQDTRRAG